MEPTKKLLDELKKLPNVHVDMRRSDMISQAVNNHECIVCESGALATWSRPESTGRSPKDTVIVKRACSEKKLDFA